MNRVTPLKQKITSTTLASLLTLLILSGLLNGCAGLKFGQILTTRPAASANTSQPYAFNKTPLPESSLPLTSSGLASSPSPTKTTLAPSPTQELTLASPTTAPTIVPTPNITLQSPLAALDLQKLMAVYLTAKGVENIILAPEQVFIDFYNKVIPDISTLRFRSSVDLVRMNIGEPVLSHHELYGDDARVQAILMGGFTTENGGYLLLGTEDSATGERAIIPVQFTFGSEGRWATVGIRRDHDAIKQMGFGGTLEFITAEELLTRVKNHLGKDILTSFSLAYPTDRQLPEDTKAADEKYFLFERMKTNNLYINDPLSIDKSDLLMSPWVGQIYY